MRVFVAVAVFGLALAMAPPADGAAVSRAIRSQTGSGQLGPDYVRADAGDLGAGADSAEDAGFMLFDTVLAFDHVQHVTDGCAGG